MKFAATSFFHLIIPVFFPQISGIRIWNLRQNCSEPSPVFRTKVKVFTADVWTLKFISLFFSLFTLVGQQRIYNIYMRYDITMLFYVCFSGVWCLCCCWFGLGLDKCRFNRTCVNEPNDQQKTGGCRVVRLEVLSDSFSCLWHIHVVPPE